MFLANRPTLLVTGGSGFIGSALVNSLRFSYPTHFTYHSNEIKFDGVFGHQLDLKEELRMDGVFSAVRPKVVIHTAAMTSAMECEKDWGRTYDVNVRAVSDLITHCRRFDAKFVLLSTDLVFEGRRGNYEELDDCFPVNRYGKSKHLGLDESLKRLKAEFDSPGSGRLPMGKKPMLRWRRKP